MGMTEKESALFSRTELLLGASAMEKISTAKVIVFGIGGVGSWCVESLVRSGVRHITLVDADAISPSNVNRQLMATSGNIGQVKVDIMRERLLEINPEKQVLTVKISMFGRDTPVELEFGQVNTLQ